jgi:hypothetical protein
VAERITGAKSALQRLERCYSNGNVSWEQCFQPRWERGNFASRYHLVYPGLAFWVLLRAEPRRAAALRPMLDAMYRGLLEPRCWDYWHSELNEETWPLQERNLTYAGRLASFTGFYIDAFGVPPSETIRIENHIATYSELSENLWAQMKSSPSCGVTCYGHTSMVMCNAHLLINNILHDRLFGTRFAVANEKWLANVEANLVNHSDDGSLFYYGTKPHSGERNEADRSDGMDIWALFLMSAVVPDRVRTWFGDWQSRIRRDEDRAWVEIPSRETKGELSSTPLATAWAFCLAKELGQTPLALALGRTLELEIAEGFKLDPLLSGLYLLGDTLREGAFRDLVVGTNSCDTSTRPQQALG